MLIYFSKEAEAELSWRGGKPVSSTEGECRMKKIVEERARIKRKRGIDRTTTWRVGTLTFKPAGEKMQG